MGGRRIRCKGSEQEAEEGARRYACPARRRPERSAREPAAAGYGRASETAWVPAGHQPGRRARDRAVPHRLVLHDLDRQGLVRRDPPRPAGGHRRRARGQDRVRDARDGAGHADHRRLERGVGPDHARRLERDPAAGGRRSERPPAGLHPEGPPDQEGPGRGHGGIPVQRPPAPVPARDSDRQGAHREPERDPDLPTRARPGLRRLRPVRLRAGPDRSAPRRPGRERRGRPVIVTGGSIFRTGLLVLLGVVIQISGLSQFHVLGASPDLTPLIVAAVALWAGSVPGAVTGFFVGLLLDLALGQNLGSSSLVLSAVGYGVGRYGELRDPAHGLIAIPVGAAATAGYLTAFAAVSFMLETAPSISALVLRDTLVTTILNAIVAVPIFGLVRRVIRPVLLAQPAGRRRRAHTRETGPIGLRGLEV
ncbi:MAG: rod shape-determining protein MreD [Actinobacteria bacterium]|nr:MAG: rod shape-determining protein MreD [Actinomycetota bacterium]